MTATRKYHPCPVCSKRLTAHPNKLCEPCKIRLKRASAKSPVPVFRP